MDAVGGERDREVRAALALEGVAGLGPAAIRLLIDTFGSARAVLAAAAHPGGGGGRAALSDPAARALERVRGVRAVSVPRLDGLRRYGTRVVSYGTADYPQPLVHLHHPPPILYLRGNAPVEQPRAVAIVGTRRATEYGHRLAGDIATGLAGAGHAVVSGLARGIDAAAHRACLAAGGTTIGVLGSGLDHAYPASSADLFRRVPEQGVLVSEFAPDVTPRAGFFPRRNRIIAALAEAVVVVQAGRKSGALITVGHALELGREVFAVPGPVGIPASEGVHGLLRDGAALATSAEDILRVVGDAVERAALPPEPESGGDDDRSRILQLLCDGLTDVDEMCRVTRLTPGRTLAMLSLLELEGRARALPGGRFGPAPHEFSGSPIR
jgi:DNA processing protein